MSGDRLDMGFVTWQGQRVFVPTWFGAPRIVPTAEDEVWVLKLKYWVYGILAAYIVADFASGIWFSLDSSIETFALVGALLQSVIPLILGVLVYLEGRRIKRWPTYAESRLSRSGLMLGYFRSLPAKSRVFELCLGLFGLWIFARMLIHAGEAALAKSADAWSPASIAFAVLVLGALALATFLAARYALIVALALVPRALWQIYRAS